MVPSELCRIDRRGRVDIHKAKGSRSWNVTCRLVVLNISTYAIVAAAAISPASAIDCMRATGVVETAICADSGLRTADERFNRGYLDLLGRLDARQRQELIESEKVWLTGRDTLCKSAPLTGVAGCISDAIIRREDELAKKFSGGFTFGQVRLGEAGQALVVGHERLDVVRLNEDTLQLVQGNTVIAESGAPFKIDGRSGDDNGEAVVVSTHDYGNGGFSNQYLVWSLPGRPLRVEALKADCWNYYDVNKKGTRLELRTTASPGCDGIVETWSAQGGLRFERKIEFSPKRGTTMADFHDNESPIDNEQFYNSLKRLAPRDWRPMARALSSATVRSDEDDKYVVLSPCSTGHSCQGGNAFAAYAKGSQNFFFADEQRSGVKYFPDRSKWPTELTQIVDQWVKGEMRD
jgi:uncharacterized protein YecT (DUF1311 family)